jgi:hypothetical protein
MKFWNASGFGKFLCLMGGVLAAWAILERVTEEVFFASISQCAVWREADTVLVMYAEGGLRISCSVGYERQGKKILARLIAPQPLDFDPRKESRWVEVSVSPLNPKVARFRNSPKDWETPLAKTLVLEFVGFLFIVVARRQGGVYPS